MPMMDTCAYCGKEYPGMTVWVKKKMKLWVCHALACRRRAEKAGFRRLR